MILLGWEGGKALICAGAVATGAGRRGGPGASARQLALLVLSVVESHDHCTVLMGGFPCRLKSCSFRPSPRSMRPNFRAPVAAVVAAVAPVVVAVAAFAVVAVVVAAAALGLGVVVAVGVVPVGFGPPATSQARVESPGIAASGIVTVPGLFSMAPASVTVSTC